MVRFTGIHHLAMVTGNMDKTIRFWRDLLGMRLVAGLGKPGYRHYFFEISNQDLLAFFEWPGVVPVPEKDHGYPVEGPVTFNHISFGVDSEDDLWELKDKLDATGFWVSEVVDHGFIHSIYSFDPNGISIEFSYAVQAVDVRSKPRMIDALPSLITREGPEPRPGEWPPVAKTTLRAERRVFLGEGRDLVGEKRDTW
jgi:catechol 2,3-dioxygenase-like lactoylglutathione lyase family enzyme